LVRGFKSILLNEFRFDDENLILAVTDGYVAVLYQP